MKVGVRNISGRFVRSFDVLVRLPWSNVVTLIVQHNMTVGELQSLVEFISGIPSQLFQLSYKANHVLDEDVTLQEVKVTQGAQFKVSMLPEYDNLVSSTYEGNFKEVMSEIHRFKGQEEIAFRKGAVVYLAAHRGHHHLVERLLSRDTMLPTFTTNLLRTPLHAACAMGNLTCVESLLQHRASHTAKDNNGQSPLDVAFSCGQREVQLRIHRHQQSRQQRLVGLKTSASGSWSKSPSKFPVSRLARSISPVIALRELAIQPSPAVMVASCTERRTAELERGQGGELDEDTAYSLYGGESRIIDSVSPGQAQGVPSYQTASSASKSYKRPQTAPLMRNGLLRAPGSSNVVIPDHKPHHKYSSSKREEDGNSSRLSSSTEPSKSSSIAAGNYLRKNENRQGFDYQRKYSFNVTKNSRIFVMRNTHLLQEKQTSGRPSTAPPLWKRHKATREENEYAFKEWLQKKAQGAKDDRLLRKVSTMVNRAFGSKMEVSEAENLAYEKAETAQRKGVSHEEWKKMKSNERNMDKGKQEREGLRCTTDSKQRRRSHTSQWYEEQTRDTSRQRNNKTQLKQRTKEAETTFNKSSYKETGRS